MNHRPSAPIRLHIDVRGIVQGVGFRPFVFRLAQQRGLTGWVRNDSEGVKIQVEGAPEAVNDFLAAVEAEAPPLARVESLHGQEIEPGFDREFVIRDSEVRAGEATLISPDVNVCGDCLRELFDPGDRRHRYPFINCTNCGPRYTIVLDVPYDRPNTTMRVFPMCADCERDYHDPTDRRFHAQPNACPVCGPQVWLVDGSGERVCEHDDAIRQAQRLLSEGRILAVKGLGGFHLAADARNEEAVRTLRERKRREQKPLAIMCPDLDVARQFCEIGEPETQLLRSPQRPIVLCSRRSSRSPDRDQGPVRRPSPTASSGRHGLPTMASAWPGDHAEQGAPGLAPSVAPRSQYLGVMLPYTPLHYLLLHDGPDALVMTSGNLTDEPISTDNDEARSRLHGIADAFLLHDRDIHLRADDSVCRIDRGVPTQMRRSRGYAPTPIRLPEGEPVLAVGAELKNAVCLARGSDAFVSQHIGDLKNMETLLFFRKTIEHLERIFDARPAAIAHDLHPDYLSTRYAQERSQRDPSVRLVGVQHHFAHVASCMAEHELTEKVIGISFDGTGYGSDGAVWGGEFMVADLHGFERVGHLRYVPLPGGDAAVKKPSRMAIAYLEQAFGDRWLKLDLPLLTEIDQNEASVVATMIRTGLNTLPTSSMGRLFDAVSALCGVAYENSYEGQAAIELEAVLDEDEDGEYEPSVVEEDGKWLIDGAAVVRAAVEDLMAGSRVPLVSARFHRTVVRLVVDICLRIRDRYQIETVCLSGGVFQNQHLIEWGAPALEAEGLRVLTQRLVPANDGGIALGQAAVVRNA